MYLRRRYHCFFTFTHSLLFQTLEIQKQETTTEYNYDYVSVVGNTFITIDNSTDSPIAFTKSIYGAGNGATYNNGTVNDGSTIKIRDLGSSTNSHVMTSIERTGRLYISNSFVELLGKQDVNNQYKKTSYTLNRIIIQELFLLYIIYLRRKISLKY